jgi:hypothetical protein
LYDFEDVNRWIDASNSAVRVTIPRRCRAQFYNFLVMKHGSCSEVAECRT